MTAVSSNDAAFRSADGFRQDAVAVARDTLDPKAWEQRWNGHDCRRVWPASAALIVFLLVPLAGQAFGQTPPIPSPSDLKNLSLDELQAIEVTSVSMRPEKL